MNATNSFLSETVERRSVLLNLAVVTEDAGDTDNSIFGGRLLSDSPSAPSVPRSVLCVDYRNRVRRRSSSSSTVAPALLLERSFPDFI